MDSGQYMGYLFFKYDDVCRIAERNRKLRKKKHADLSELML